MTGRPARRQIPEHRRAAYYVGLGLNVVGLIVFGSVFVTGCASFGDFTNFDERARGAMGRALAGMAIVVVGSVLMRLGRQGLAGSGTVLDPERARTDLEPWSRMAGGVVKDALDEAGLHKDARSEDAPAVKVRCLSCQALNDEHDRFCGQCGKPLA